MSEEPYPTDRISDPQFEALVRNLCARPGMYVGNPPTFDSVCSYLDGFNAARGCAPLLGLREWLVVRANEGNNLHWSALVMRLAGFGRERVANGDQYEMIQALGCQIEEYLRYRHENGITKVYYDYGKWLLRKRWYRGPLRQKGGSK